MWTRSPLITCTNLPRFLESFVRVLILVLALSSTTSVETLAQSRDAKWQAVQTVGPQRDCAASAMNVRWEISEKDGYLSGKSDGVTSWRVATKNLHPDGSGQLNLKDNKGRPFRIEFQAGNGPRLVHLRLGNGTCVLTLTPL